MNNPFLIGEKTYLRPLEPADAELATRWINDPELTRTLTFARPMSKARETSYLAEIGQSQNDVVLGICLRDGDRLIGICGLHAVDSVNRHATFGIFIGDKGNWGQGFGSEATRLMTGYGFETLNLHRIMLHVVEHNERAIRAYEKVGYKVEGTLRQAFFREGRYWDMLVMSVLQEEWKG